MKMAGRKKERAPAFWKRWQERTLLGGGHGSWASGKGVLGGGEASREKVKEGATGSTGCVPSHPLSLQPSRLTVVTVGPPSGSSCLGSSYEHCSQLLWLRSRSPRTGMWSSLTLPLSICGTSCAYLGFPHLQSGDCKCKCTCKI